MDKQELIEQLAEKEHSSWSRWMQYLFSKCSFASDGAAMIPSELAARWNRQMCTFYEDLSEQEKQSDRDEVAHILPIIEAYAHSEPRNATPLETIDLRLHRIENTLRYIDEKDTTTRKPDGVVLVDDAVLARGIADLQRQVSLLHDEVFCTDRSESGNSNKTLLGHVNNLYRLVFALQGEESKRDE